MWTKIGAVLAVVIPLSGGVWWVATQTAFAEDQAKEQEKIVEAVEVLKDIHLKQETVREAEIRLKAKLCAEGKLTGADCVGVQ